MLGRRILERSDAVVADVRAHAQLPLAPLAARCFSRQAAGMIDAAHAGSLIGLVGRMDLTLLVEQELLRIDGCWKDEETLQAGLPPHPWRRCPSIRYWIEGVVVSARHGASHGALASPRWVVLAHPGGAVAGGKRAWGHDEACEQLARARLADPTGWPCLGRLAPLAHARRAHQPTGCALLGTGWGGIGSRAVGDAHHDVEGRECLDGVIAGLERDARLMEECVATGRCGEAVALVSHQQYAWGMLEAIRCLVSDPDGALERALRVEVGTALPMIAQRTEGRVTEPVPASRLFKDGSAPGPGAGTVRAGG